MLSKSKYYPAVIMASVPVAVEFIINNLAEGGLAGLAMYKPGSAFIGLIVGCLFVFIIDNNWRNAAVTSVIAVGLTAIGMIHSPSIV